MNESHCVLSSGLYLPNDHPGARLSKFGAPTDDASYADERGAYAALFVAKKMRNV